MVPLGRMTELLASVTGPERVDMSPRGVSGDRPRSPARGGIAARVIQAGALAGFRPLGAQPRHNLAREQVDARPLVEAVG